MNKSRSIKQKLTADTLPNFRNLGVTMRILLISNGIAVILAVSQAGGWLEIVQRFVQIASLLTPVLLCTLILLWAAQPLLDQLRYWRGMITINVVVALLALVTGYAGEALFGQRGNSLGRFELFQYALLSVVVTSILLTYFRMRTQALSSSLHDARLQVLRARIRPHFLFNTINAVLAIVRTQPKQAETALEDMADLFRMAMTDARDLVPLQKEIQLSKQYIALERMRMGERLNVEWYFEALPDGAMIPQLLLQPLLENAVYHGIEPLQQGGSIKVQMRRLGDELHIHVENPRVDGGEGSHKGNKIALLNIRERLNLLFDVEASYKVENGKDFYRVEIILPYVTKRPKLKERST
jgi:two-component system sensor histidine kinase AlgZ